MENLIYRQAKIGDFQEITKIYNYHILNGFGTFEETPITNNEMKKRFNKSKKLNLPFLICEKRKKIIGFCYLSIYRNRSAYKHTFENSIYIKKKYDSRGIGHNLLEFLMKESKKNNHIKNIIAVIGDKNNIGSIKIHKKVGFKYIGILKKVGFKKNKWIDVILMLKKINAESK